MWNPYFSGFDTAHYASHNIISQQQYERIGDAPLSHSRNTFRTWWPSSCALFNPASLGYNRAPNAHVYICRGRILLDLLLLLGCTDPLLYPFFYFFLKPFVSRQYLTLKITLLSAKYHIFVHWYWSLLCTIFYLKTDSLFTYNVRTEFFTSFYYKTHNTLYL
jgi:hypothetical protein